MFTLHRFTFTATLTMGLIPATMLCAHAQNNYPSKPVRIVVPFTAGGGTDVIARMLGMKMGDAWGQPIVIENRTGAGGTIGANLVAKATPDGHTIIINSTSQTINPYVTKVNYNLERDFAAIIRPATLPYVLAVPSVSPAKSIKELVALCKAAPGKYSYAGTFGSASHFMGEMLKAAGKIDISLVSYKSTSDAVTEPPAATTMVSRAAMPSMPSMKLKKLIAAAR